MNIESLAALIPPGCPSAVILMQSMGPTARGRADEMQADDDDDYDGDDEKIQG